MSLDGLNLEEYSVLYSLDTGDLFISEDREIFLIANNNLETGMKEISGNANIEARPCKLSDKQLMEQAYDLGAHGIRVYGQERIPINTQQKRVKYSNPELKFAYARLLITSEEKYLDRLGTCHFIVPVDLTSVPGPRTTKQLLMYPVAAPHGGKADKDSLGLYYLAFTDLSSFSEWNRKQNGYWRPLELEFWQLREVYGDSGICINYGLLDCAFLDSETLGRIRCDVPDMGVTVIDEEDLPV